MQDILEYLTNWQWVAAVTVVCVAVHAVVHLLG